MDDIKNNDIPLKKAVPLRDQQGIGVSEFLAFYHRIMDRHRWGVLGLEFCPKYVNFSVDTRDGQIWSITMRDIIADDATWAKIPDPWKQKDGNLVKVVIQDAMTDGFNGLAERIGHLMKITERKKPL